MDNIRLFLIFALAYTGFLLWQAWQEDYGQQSQVIQQEQSSSTNESDRLDSLPDAPTVASIDEAVPAMVGATGTTSSGNPASRLIDVETDMFRLKLDTEGGSIVQVYLEKYPISVEQPDVKFKLMSRDASDFFITQAGLLTADKSDAPDHKAVFTAGKDSYQLAEDQNELVVDLQWKNENGVLVTKRYRFTRGSHQVELEHIIENGSASEWMGREYRQFQRGEPADSGNAMMYTYTGGAIYSPADKYQKYDFDELSAGELDRDVKDGWIAMMQHYFLAAFVPPRGQTDHFYGKGLATGTFVIGSYTPSAKVSPGATHTYTGSLYIGPKDQEDLAALADGLDLTVDYGWLAIIAQPMYWVLSWIQGIVGNWGWTIIIFTILIKLVFFKLSETSYRSMANMRKMTPRIQALKDRYGDDKQRMQQAMMEIYKKEKINPLGGCLPMLAQMPFFIALYWVLLETVELRQAPWIFWIEDLSIKDPFFVLPLIMGVSMFLQQKLNPQPPDPMQAKMMMMLPVVFTVMFAFFPSGLVLYWVMNNILSIAQQWVITRRIEQAA